MNTRIMQALSVITLFGMVGLFPGRMHATQSGDPVSDGPGIRPGIAASEGELTTAVQARLSRGEAFQSRLRYAEAEREYRIAAATARRQGHLPSLAMWRLANAHYHAGQHSQAALVLDQLAAEAARVGDLGVEALALFNAAWVDGQAGRGRQAGVRVAQLRRLMESPYMPSAIRRHLGARLDSLSDLAVER
jgi:hypothetical protein